MIVESRESNDPGNSENCEGAVMVSNLNFVDLAGSERTSQTGAEGVRLKEGCNINRSLFILGQVIKKLSDDQTGNFINYRDSKLTRILQNSLGGNTKTVIICTITPVSFDETLSTLQFASAAKNVKNKAHVNEVLDDAALLKRYRKEIMDLKKQLEDLEESSVSKTSAMAKEEHTQLLAVIQQLQKEKEERVSNLKNIVIDAAMSQEEQPKRKRRVTWAAEKIKSTLYGSGVSPFDAGSKIGTRFPKRPKISDLQTLHEHDDSVCTEFSDLDDTTRVFEDFYPEWDFGSKVTLRDRPALHHSMIDFNSDAPLQNSTLLKDSSSPKNNTLEQKIAELEKRLKTMANDYAAEVEKRQSFEKETLQLREQLEAKEEEKDKLVNAHQLEITSLRDQIENRPDVNEVGVGLEATDQLEDLDTNITQSEDKMNIFDQYTQTEQVQDNCENLSSGIHDICQEQIQMLEQKVADLEENHHFAESLQICEALMQEEASVRKELADLQESFDNVVVENESLKQEIAKMEKELQEKNETNEFEMLEKETQKEHETELENTSKVLKEKEKLIAELKKDAEVLLKKARYSDLSISMGGDGEKLCEEVFQLKQSLDDAQTVTRDSQREAAFLRSENIELKEKMDECSCRCEQREKDATSLEKQLETEKANYKRMQADLQKELQCAFNEINQLNGLMNGRVPKDLLTRVELEKKIADCSKQLTNALEEKTSLEKEVANLSELKHLPSEIEQLKNQIQKTSEELHLLQNEKEHADILISDQNGKMQEQKEQIERLTEEVTNTQSKFQQAEQQYSEFQVLYEELQTRCSLTDEELKKKFLESECLVKDINDLKNSLEILEGELFKAQQEKEELAQAQQEQASQTNSLEEMLKLAESERDDLQKQLSSLVETLQQQEEMQSQMIKEKQDLDQKHLQLMSEMEQLQEQLSNFQQLQSTVQAENSEGEHKLQKLQEEMTLLAKLKDELQSKVEELTNDNTVLKQDLNDNIEMSIETQDELRTTQEELKHQKQLVADLREQISDYAERISLQAESNKSTPEVCKEDSETIAEKKIELEVENQSLISGMELLKERLKSAELALATLEGEKNELLQKLHALEEDFQNVTKQKDQLESEKDKLFEEKNDLKDEMERTTKQVCEEDAKVQLLEQIEEKQKLIETLRTVTEERDQLKLDLHDNIEMSIETQEELRNALDELKENSKLLDALKAQVVHSNGQTCNIETNPKVKDNETLDKEVQVLTEEFVNEDKMNASATLELENELTLLKERIDQLQQQIHIITQEKEQNEQLMDTLKEENLQLVSVVQRHTEDEVVIQMLKEQLQNTSQELALKDQEAKQAAMRLIDLNKADQHMADLEMLEKNLQESHILLEKIQGEKLELTDKLCALQEELEKVTCYKDDLQVKLEAAQGENASIKEMSLATPQEEPQRWNELEPQESSVNGLKMQVSGNVSVQDKDTITDLMPDLEEQAHSLQEQLLQKTDEYEQLLQIKNKLEEAKNSLDCELINLSNRMAEAHINLESLQNEKNQSEQQLHDLQEKLNAAIQERDDLTIANQQLISDIDQFKSSQKGSEEMDFGFQEQLLEKTSEYEQLIRIKNQLEEDKNNLKDEVESLTNRMTQAQANMETLEKEKHQTEEQLLDLQQKVNAAVNDKDDLEIAKERLTTEINQLKGNLKENDEMILHLQQEIEQRTECQHEELNQTQHTIKNELEQTIQDLKNTETQLEAVRSEKLDTEQKLLNLQHEMELITQDWNDLKASHETLTLERNQLKEALEKNAEMLKTSENQQQQLEMAAQTDLMDSELDKLLNNLKDMESQLENVQREKVNAEERLTSVQEHIEAITKERDDLQATLMNLQSERNQLKEDLRENIEMSIETQVDLRSTQEELQHQKVRVSELETEISCLEQKSSSLEKELHETAAVLKEVTRERDNLDQSKQTLKTEVEQLIQQLKDQEVSLNQAEKEKSEASQKILELTSVLNSVAEEKDLLNCSKEDVEKQSFEMQNDLRKTQEELQQQKERVETLTSEIALQEEKLSSLQRELQENLTLFKGAVEEKEMLDQARQSLSSDKEQLLESLKSKDAILELTESEKRMASQKVLELTEEVRKLSQDKEQLELLKENLENEATKLREDFNQLQHQYAEKETQKSSRIEELLLEIEQLREKISLKDTTAQQLEMDKADIQRKVQQYELEVASLHQEQEQFQQLLQRARCEKENIYTTLQDQEKANEQLKELLTACQTELESVKKQRDESKDHLAEKVNEVNAVLLQLSSLQQQLQQLQQELKDERMKNNDLCEKVNDLEKLNKVLQLMQNEPEQEEDEIAERTETLQQQNEELKALMVNIFTVYDNHHRSLNNLTVDLQAEVESQKQSMSSIKELLSSTHTREFGTLQTEYVKLNSDLQSLLNKFMRIYRHAAVKEEQISCIKDYESDLCAVQKKNDEMLLQCQSLEQNGTKWSESAAEELKFYELEFLNHLVFKKMDVMKRVEDGFSEVQITLNSVEGDVLEEVKYKKQFLSWLEEFKGLHFDAKKCIEGIVQENRRISGVVQLLAKRFKVLVQSRVKPDTLAYINKLDEDLQERKQKNKELLQKMQKLAPSGDSNVLEVENAQLSEKLRNLQAELKKMQCRIQQLENELTSAKAHAKKEMEKASYLQEKLLSSSSETELSEMRAKVSEKEKHLETTLKEIKSLQEKVALGAAPYRDEIDNLKSQLVKFEMDRIKLSKSTDQQIASLKSSVDYKEECLRKLKEQLRRSQKDMDTTLCSEKDGSASYPLTCGGGSGIVQSTAMLMFQSENAALKREITQYRKKCHQLSRNVSSREDELKKLKDRSLETPSKLFSSPTDITSQNSSAVYKHVAVSPSKSDIPPRHMRSPGKTGIHRKYTVSPSKTQLSKPQVVSPSKTHLPKPQVMSPNKTSRHSVPPSSPGKTELNRKRALSPFKTEGRLFSNVSELPCKKQILPDTTNSPQDKFFERGKSLPYCPSKFFDNSTLGTLPDPDIYSGSTTETSEVNWWDRADKKENPNDCKTS